MKSTRILPILLILLYVGMVQAVEPSNTSFPAVLSSLTADESSSAGLEKTDSSEDPDYDLVFPNNSVQRIDLVIAADDWQKMLDNMTELYGEFGNNTMMPMGGGTFSPDNPPDEMGIQEGKSPLDTDTVYVPAKVTLNGTTLDHVGIRFKGASSLSGSWREGTYKISLKLDCDQFEDEYPEVKSQTLYGFDKLNLQSGFGDNSLMRDKVAADIFRDAGVPAPRTAFYQVYIDTGDGPVYFGLYTMIEDVADTMLSSQFADGSGNLYKPQGEREATFQNGTFNTSIFEKETNKKANDFSDLEQFYAALNSDLRISDPDAWRSDLESVFNVDEFLAWLATNTIIQNWDTYGSMAHNFYLYTDPSTGQITWIPWDNNFALQNGSEGMGGFGGGNPPGFGNMTPGNFIGSPQTGTPASGGGQPPAFGNTTSGNHPMGFPGMMGGDMNMTQHGPGGAQNLSLTEVGDEWPLIRYLIDDPVYHEKYVQAVEKVITDVFTPEKMATIYTGNHDLISQYVIGEKGEQEGYTHLKDPQDFIDSLDSLISHASSRYTAATAYLAEEGAA
ncbi:MAG: CotH kinase family protein [Methanospirillum sp.]|uniref:CotH kinase family protein n=1 Tax=Methanospirillum sp. TaxID=45200 RepID=UPI002371CF6C|nr:CotH kinase family protein [Methanospirillum sp.]MDD1727933.1 CotH kinase family protein [Methanospirillum sp.]